MKLKNLRRLSEVLERVQDAVENWTLEDETIEIESYDDTIYLRFESNAYHLMYDIKESFNDPALVTIDQGVDSFVMIFKL